MIQILPSSKINVATSPIDFRCGIDSLVGLCKWVLKSDPFSGAYFVFSNKNRRSIKILAYDGQGFWLFQKRFSQGKIAWWPKGDEGEKISPLDSRNFLLLLFNGDPNSAKFQNNWKNF